MNETNETSKKRGKRLGVEPLPKKYNQDILKHVFLSLMFCLGKNED